MTGEATVHNTGQGAMGDCGAIILRLSLLPASVFNRDPVPKLLVIQKNHKEFGSKTGTNQFPLLTKGQCVWRGRFGFYK